MMLKELRKVIPSKTLKIFLKIVQRNTLQSAWDLI